MAVVTMALMEKLAGNQEGRDRLLLEALAMLDKHDLLPEFRRRLEELESA